MAPIRLDDNDGPREVFRYTDARGDTIIYKFDASLVYDRNESPISVFHEWRQDLIKTIQWSSMLLDAESVKERYSKDKKPASGFVLWEGKNVLGRAMRCRFVAFQKNERGFVVDDEVK